MVRGEARSRFALSAVGVGVLAVSSAAILVRVSGAPALGIAFWRCALGAALLLPAVAVRRELLPVGRPLFVLVVSGVALGAHFGFWISSLGYTSVAASVVIVSTAPVFVAVFAYLLFGEKTSPVSLVGILVALAGTAVIAADRSMGSAALFGNALALIGAVAVAVYVLIGRSQRTTGVGFLPYSVIVYSAAALSLLPVALIGGVQLWDYSGETWLWLWVITLGPQILGHTVFNWALGYVEAAIVSGTILAEPVVAALLAWWILSEKPGLPTAAGGAVVLVGLFLLLRGHGRSVPPEPV